jgi:hypothetical protein
LLFITLKNTLGLVSYFKGLLNSRIRELEDSIFDVTNRAYVVFEQECIGSNNDDICRNWQLFWRWFYWNPISDNNWLKKQPDLNHDDIWILFKTLMTVNLMTFSCQKLSINDFTTFSDLFWWVWIRASWTRSTFGAKIQIIW